MMVCLLCAQVSHHLSVGGIHVSARNIADEMVVVVENGKGLRIGFIEFPHDILHGVVLPEYGRRLGHKLGNGEMMVKLCAEHDVPDV